jgi:hypothetical protein
MERSLRGHHRHGRNSARLARLAARVLVLVSD